jgi:hypothetical protein
MAIRLGFRNDRRADHAARARAVIDDYVLRHDRHELLRKDTRGHVSCAARGITNNEANRSRGKRIICCLSRTDSARNNKNTSGTTSDACTAAVTQGRHVSYNFLRTELAEELDGLVRPHEPETARERMREQDLGILAHQLCILVCRCIRS